MARREIRFRADGLDERDLRAWRRLASSPALSPAGVAGWLVAALAVAYGLGRGPFVLLPEEEVVAGVVQVVPPPGTTEASVCTPAIFFLGRPYPDDTDLSVVAVDPSGEEIDLDDQGALLRLQSAAGNTVLVHAPGAPHPAGALVTTSIVQRDPGGDPFSAEATFAVQGADEALIAEPAGERVIESARGQGDFALALDSSPERFPTAGSSEIALSTGTILADGSIAETTSYVSLGPFRRASPFSLGPLELGRPTVRLRFEYDFLSEEFDEYVDSVYDDAFLVVISGPDGAEARLVTSVNLVGAAASVPSEAGAVEGTGWRDFSLSAAVGSPACVTFVLTDVGDAALESLVAIRSLRVE